jgi:hypothetical protein
VPAFVVGPILHLQYEFRIYLPMKSDGFPCHGIDARYISDYYSKYLKSP